MEKYTTGYTSNASLVMIVEWTKAHGLWEKLADSVHIHQKTIVHSPPDKLKDLLIHIWAGGERLSDVNHRVRTDAALQRLFSRQTCAEQSTINETVNATTSSKLAQHSTTIAKFGMVHFLRGVCRNSGKVLFDENGVVHLIILYQAHQLASAVHKTWHSCFACNVLSLILGKN